VRKILVMGLPGAGKTTLARIVARRLNAVHFNADEVRENVSRDLGFSLKDRIEHASRMGWLCDRVTETGGYAVADFICPTRATREAFGACFTVLVDRISASRFEDTNMLFERPDSPDLVVSDKGGPEYWAELLCARVRPVFDAARSTAFMLGRFQPFHDGHKALAEEGIRRHGQVCIAVRDTHGDDKNPYTFEQVRARIDHALREHQGRYVVVPVPNIVSILYGRDVGYSVEQVKFGKEVEAISGSGQRAKTRVG
jgi:adenylylsulfate kinase